MVCRCHSTAWQRDKSCFLLLLLLLYDAWVNLVCDWITSAACCPRWNACRSSVWAAIWSETSVHSSYSTLCSSELQVNTRDATERERDTDCRYNVFQVPASVDSQHAAGRHYLPCPCCDFYGAALVACPCKCRWANCILIFTVHIESSWFHV